MMGTVGIGEVQLMTVETMQAAFATLAESLGWRVWLREKMHGNQIQGAEKGGVRISIQWSEKHRTLWASAHITRNYRAPISEREYASRHSPAFAWSDHFIRERKQWNGYERLVQEHQMKTFAWAITALASFDADALDI